MMGLSIKVYFDFMTFTRKSCVAMIKIATVSCLCCSETVWHQHRHTTKMENITLPNSSHKHWWPELIKPNRSWTDPVLLDPSPSPAHSCRRPSSTFSHRDLQSRDGEDVCSCSRSLTDMVCLFSLSLLSAEPVPRLILVIASREDPSTWAKPFLLHKFCTRLIQAWSTAQANRSEWLDCGMGWKLALLAKTSKTLIIMKMIIIRITVVIKFLGIWYSERTNHLPRENQVPPCTNLRPATPSNHWQLKTAVSLRAFLLF